ncbi:conserved exported hypothetical protein [Flavobacterium sp. 9AF]|uniref:hypothetical protein n=1 Tax=Flavobacterium sp. 9AF TaxID=2653142 RepID=UPI0012F107A3|nr:hypothetical protein [Flavobacterium sp. 9AF]VXB54898.1 conserved exported hypothetical protein [Flavobacterium sp. 9AF]
MKKIFLIAILLISAISFSQKKKTTSKKSNNKTVLAKVDNVTAEMISIKNQKQIVLFVSNGSVQDTIKVKTTDNSNFSPLNFKITPFTTNNLKFYYLHWEENNSTNTKLKKEDQSIIESQIWNVEKKELLLGNIQKNSHIVETVFLDKNKTASETQERNRKEGFEFNLLPNGDFTLKNKTQNDTYVYNTTTNKYEIKRGTSTKTSTTRKKR